MGLFEGLANAYRYAILRDSIRFGLYATYVTSFEARGKTRPDRRDFFFGGVFAGMVGKALMLPVDYWQYRFRFWDITALESLYPEVQVRLYWCS